MALADGTVVLVRPIVPEDAFALGDEIMTADAETLYQRFFTTNVQADRSTLDRLTVLDYATTLALGCIHVATGAPVGIARYAAVDGETVEVAVAVKHGWRRRGVGTLLLGLVEEAAASRGFIRLSAFHLGENHRAAALLARRGYKVVGAERGVVELARAI